MDGIVNDVPKQYVINRWVVMAIDLECYNTVYAYILCHYWILL